MLQGVGSTGERSRILRQAMSPPEVTLWMALRARPEGLKFRKQHPSGPFTADFYCHQARLVVEVDGSAHNYGDRPSRYEQRDRWFEARGLAVMRVTANDVFRDCEAVVHGVVALALTRIADQE